MIKERFLLCYCSVVECERWRKREKRRGIYGFAFWCVGVLYIGFVHCVTGWENTIPYSSISEERRGDNGMRGISELLGFFACGPRTV